MTNENGHRKELRKRLSDLNVAEFEDLQLFSDERLESFILELEEAHRKGKLKLHTKNGSLNLHDITAKHIDAFRASPPTEADLYWRVQTLEKELKSLRTYVNYINDRMEKGFSGLVNQFNTSLIHTDQRLQALENETN